ncbi:MAG: outer membrane protein assembly factor BamB [Pseudomonadota bacterium]
MKLLMLAAALAALTLSACNSVPVADTATAAPLKAGELARLPEKAIGMDDRWSVSIGNGAGGEALYLEPGVQAPAIYVASRDGVLKSIGRASGSLRWKVKLSDGVTGGVAVDDDLLIVGTDQSDLLAINNKNGKPVWRAALGSALLSTPRLNAKEVVVQTLDGRVQVFERATGKRRWQFDTPVPPLSLRGNAAPVISNDKVYAVSGQGDLYQLDLASGLPIWQTRVTNSRGRGEIERLMDIDGDLVLDSNGTLYTAGFQSQLTATDTQQVRRRWQLNVSTTESVAVDNAQVYAVDVDGTLAAINKITGALVWKQETLKGRKLLAPVIWRGLVVIGDSEGYLHVFSPLDGAVRGRERAAREPLMSVVVDAPQLLTLTVDGTLRAWDMKL